MDRWRQAVERQVARIECRHAVNRREQHLSVRRQREVRRVGAHTIGPENPVRCVQHGRPDGGRTLAAVHGSGPRVQVSPGDPCHSALHVDPRRAVIAHGAGVDPVARQAALAVQRGDAARFQSAQAAFGGDPDAAVRVGANVVDDALAQSLARRIGLPRASIDDMGDPAGEKAQPHPAPDGVGRQAPRRPARRDLVPRNLLHDAIAGDLLQARLPTRDPQAPVVVLRDRIDVPAGHAHGGEVAVLENSQRRTRSEPKPATAIPEQGGRPQFRETWNLDGVDGSR